MNVDFNDYVTFDPGVTGPWRDLHRSEAKAAYERLMAAKPERLEALGALVRQAGIELPSASAATDHDLDTLEKWFRTGIVNTDAPELPKIWYSVVSDSALYLGDVIVGRAGNLSWTFYTGNRRGLHYQESVITGFRAVPNPRYLVNPGYLLAGMAENLKAGRWTPDRNFAEWVNRAVADDTPPAVRW